MRIIGLVKDVEGDVDFVGKSKDSPDKYIKITK